MNVELAASRKEGLSQAVAAVRARWGVAALAPGSASPARLGEAPTAGISSGFAELDALTPAAGFPCGRVSLCLGGPGTGRMSLAHHLLAQASQVTAVSLLLDLRGHADPWLMRLTGARLERVLVLRADLETALEAAVALVRAGVGCVVADLPPKAGHAPAWDPWAQALAAACARERACCLVSAEAVGEPLAYASSLTLRLRRLGWVSRHGDVDGARVEVTVEKSKLSLPGATAEIELAYPRGLFLPPRRAAAAGAAPAETAAPAREAAEGIGVAV